MDKNFSSQERAYLEPAWPEPLLVDFAGGEIYPGEEYFCIDGMAVLPASMKEFLAEYYGIDRLLMSDIIWDSGAELDKWAKNLGGIKCTAGEKHRILSEEE